jgi:archaellum biogenesis protein FlaJ (TadC family)
MAMGISIRPSTQYVTIFIKLKSASKMLLAFMWKIVRVENNIQVELNLSDQKFWNCLTVSARRNYMQIKYNGTESSRGS